MKKHTNFSFFIIIFFFCITIFPIEAKAISYEGFKNLKDYPNVTVLNRIGEGAYIDRNHSFSPVLSRENTKVVSETNTTHRYGGVLSGYNYPQNHLLFDTIDTEKPVSVTLKYENVGLYNGKSIAMLVEFSSNNALGMDTSNFLPRAILNKADNTQNNVVARQKVTFIDNDTNVPVSVSGNITINGFNNTQIVINEDLPLKSTQFFVLNNTTGTYNQNLFSGTVFTADSRSAMTFVFDEVESFILETIPRNPWGRRGNGFGLGVSNRALTNVELPSPYKEGKTIEDSDSVQELYIISQNVPFQNPTGYFDSFTINDYLSEYLNVDIKNVRIHDRRNSSDVTENFNITLDTSNRLEVTAKIDKLKNAEFYGTTYDITINGILDKNKDWSALIKNGYLEIPNTAQLLVGSQEISSNEAVTKIADNRKGNVIVKYVDIDGNELVDSIVISGKLGENYKIDYKEIEGYTLKEVRGNLDGQFKVEEQIVTYIYTKDPIEAGGVTAKYVDENGNEISNRFSDNGYVGEVYTTEQKIIAGYTFKEVQGNPIGIFTEEEQIVTYIYTKDPVKSGGVTARYVDENGNEISNRFSDNGYVGEVYTTEQKIIAGYTFKEVQGNPTGIFTEEEQVVTYIYTKDLVEGELVTARYVDEAGNVIADNSSYSGYVGESYVTEQKIIAGYTFKEVQGNPTGTFTEEEQVVTYVYTKDPIKAGGVTAKYVDENGNEISNRFSDNGYVGEVYTTEQKIIAGYTFKEVQGNPIGMFTEEEQIVTYIYTKDPVKSGGVTARYVDENGNEISDRFFDNGYVGEGYTTEQKRIAGYTFKEVQGNPTGKFTEEEKIVIYIYKKDLAAGATITAKYVDESGNVIADDIIYSGNIGEIYTTEQRIIEGYTFRNVQGNISGVFTEEEKVVTFVYTKNKENSTNQVGSSENNQAISRNKSVDKNMNQKELPRAGERTNNFLFYLGGFFLMSVVSVKFFYKLKLGN